MSLIIFDIFDIFQTIDFLKPKQAKIKQFGLDWLD